MYWLAHAAEALNTTAELRLCCAGSSLES